MLHVTNGDSAAELIAGSGLSETVLPWRDVLHEGPIPAGLSLDELRDVRARFIADRGWGSYARVRADLAQRDETLAAFREHEEVVLWFEHDIYDQLQLLQILDWFAGQTRGATALSLICIGTFPDVAPFHGLGQLTAAQIASLFPTRRPVSTEQLNLARAAWTAIRSSDPTDVERIIRGDTRSLPFLRQALIRFLEEYPGLRGGLSRTERQALEELCTDNRTPVELFRASVDREERPFLGDLTFWTQLRGLAAGSFPLLAPLDGTRLAGHPKDQDPAHFAHQPFAVTDQGRAVVAGEADQVMLNGIDRWLGGVHLEGHIVSWRWDDSVTPARLLRVA
ncbi:MAG: hypothetical protein QOF33_1343 [Thermomicrobiales bacterium]|nr:hypothetical protein [Thermomicrobiales bacterium]